MKLNTLVYDLDFYLRAIGRGAELVLVLGVLTVRSVVTSEPIF